MATLEAGQPAPDFEGETQTGAHVSLRQLRGSVVVLFFYPKDNTPGCTTEACSFRDLRPAFEEAGAKVFGVSRDSMSSHQKFDTKYDLKLPLIADTTAEICTSYGVLKEKTMFGRKVFGIERTTVVIDKHGTIAKIYPKVRVDGHAKEVLEFVRTMS